jgi:hypothetical protein
MTDWKRNFPSAQTRLDLRAMKVRDCQFSASAWNVMFLPVIPPVVGNLGNSWTIDPIQ